MTEPLRQRERINLHDGTHWVYEYDSLGQVTAGRRRLADETTVVNGLDFGYSYDDIGNRLAATRGAREWLYTPNGLNQYDERSVPGAIDTLGTAHEDAIVTVNDEETTRQGDWWYRELEVDNDPDAVWQDIEVVGVRPEAGPDGKDVVTVAERQAFVPGTPEAYTHDLDGNLLSAGRWTYTWDAENRLISVVGQHCAASTPTCTICGTTPTQVKISYTYDERWRRVARELRAWDAVGEAWGPVLQRTRYLYDGWNVLAELDDAELLTARYTWGLDLAEQVSGGAVAASGPARSAGGIGGLLLAEIALPADLASPPGAGPGTHSFSATGWVGADANGNVILWSSTGPGLHSVSEVGTPLASYAYDPFGNPLVDGPALHSLGEVGLPYTFSTKPHDPLTAHAYYGYRWYTADTGRWLSRDPIGEKGGTNLTEFVHNSPLTKYDILGLLSPIEFWDEWQESDRIKWVDRFKKNHRSSICASAKKHCIPGELLAAIIANEQIDYTWQEHLLELLGIGDSVGLSQIRIDTAIKYGLTDCRLSDYKDMQQTDPLSGIEIFVSAVEQYESCVRRSLQRDSGSIEAAARLMKQYLDSLCQKSQNGALSRSFLGFSVGCKVKDFCCRAAGDKCSTINAPSCLISALAATWNNGIKITEVDNIHENSPNAEKHAGNASLLDGYFEKICD